MAIDFSLGRNAFNPLQVLQSFGQAQQRVREDQERLRQEQAQSQLLAAYDVDKGGFDPTRARQALIAAGDPQALMGFDRNQAVTAKAQKEQADDLHEFGLSLLNTVTDEQSYQNAKRIARQRGIAEVDQFPETFDANAQAIVGAMKQEYQALNPVKPEASPSVIRSLEAIGIDPQSPEGRAIVIQNLNPPQYQAFGDQLLQTRGPGVEGSGQALSGPQIEQTATGVVPGIQVTSRQRDPAANRRAGGVDNSYHLTDQARDFVPPQGMSMGQLASNLRQAMPGMDVINEGDHVHVEPSRRTSGGPRVVATKPADAPKQNAKGIYQNVSEEAYKRLPSGAKYMDPRGNVRTKR